MGEIRRTWGWSREWDNRSELTLSGIAFSVKGNCTELSWILDQGRGEKRANTLFFGFSTSN